jgi:DNA-binding transcriptional MerR regulator
MDGGASKSGGKKQTTRKRRLKMKDLSEATGVNGATIRYYINEGLLPKPYKPFRNMAYYDASFVDKIKFIKTLQKDYFLPLEVIRVGIKESGYDLQAMVNKLDRAKQMAWVFEPDADPQNGSETVTRERLAESTGMTAADLKAAISHGLIFADENGLFHKKEIEIARYVARIRQSLTDARGFPFELIIQHYKMFESLVDTEFEAFLRNVINNKITVEEANEMAEIILDVLKDLFPLIHRRRLSKKIKESLVIK